MRRKAQGLIEYSVLICVIAAALVAMQVYIKRSIQGRVKSSADELGGGFGYSPGATSANNLTSRNITEHKLAEKSINVQTTRLQIATELAQAGSATLDLGKLLSQVVNLIKDRLGYYHVAVYLLDQPGVQAVPPQAGL